MRIPRPVPSAASWRRALVFAAAVVAGAAAPWPRSRVEAQEPPARGGAAVSTAEGRKVRGILAWRRAVWTSDGASFATAARALEEARAAGGGEDDVTVLFLLGHCLARTGQGERASEPLRRAREIAPSFPGHWLGEALRLTADRPAVQESPATRESLPLLDRYLVEVARYDRQAPFSAELRYLGALERGLRLFAIDSHDRAVADLRQAVEIARADGRTPSAELVRTLAECHKKLSEPGPAEELLLGALRRDPGEATHYHVLGLVAADQHQMKAARDWYAGAVERRPEFAESHVKLAYIAWEEGDLYTMRCHLEAYDHQLTARWTADPSSRNPDTAANLHSAFGAYWLARGDRLADASDMDGARRLWERARDRFLQSVAEHPGCKRALSGLVQILPRLGAPREEVERWENRLREIQEGKPGAPAARRDTFC